MNRKSLLKCLTVICLIASFSACSDEKTDGLSPEKATATYSNKLSTPENANRLSLTYSGHQMIGKDVSLETKDGTTAKLSLSYIFPNQPETVLENIQLSKQTDEQGYSFSGNTTTNQGISFYYEGVVTEGKLSLTLSGIQYPDNPLTQTRTWNVVHNAERESYREQDPETENYITYYTDFKTAYTEIGVTNGLLGTLNGLVINPILSNIFSLVLNKVNFLPDGNITASYAGLPEDMPITGMINNYITEERPASVWQTSPINLASYYLADDTVLYVLPHIDMIVQQIRSTSTKASALESLDMESLKAIYAKINKWSTEGIRLIAKPNPYNQYVTTSIVSKQRSAGDYLIYIEKSEIQELFSLIGLLPLFVDEQLLTTPLTYVIAGMGIEIPEEYKALVEMMLGSMTLETLLQQIQQELIGGDLRIGIFLNK